jgi:hypothetical protein
MIEYVALGTQQQLKEGEHLEELGADCKIILRCTLKK